MGANGTKQDALVSHGFEAALKLGSAIGQSGWWAIGPRSPRKRLIELWVVVFDGLGEVYVASEVRAFVPVVEQTFEDESGFSDASGAVEDQRLRNTVVLSVVV